MTEVQQLAHFVTTRKKEDVSDQAREALKIRLLDSIACAIGALEGEPIRMLRDHIEEFGGKPLVNLMGGGRTAPDRAAFYNSALIRYLDYNDSYLAKDETCHPSDNIGSVLAAAEYAGASGTDFITALAIAYQIQCRLSDEAPVRNKGFDHTVQGANGAAAGAAYALSLDENQTANAIAIAGTAYNALRVTRTGNLSHWKGLAFPSVGWTSTHSAFLAMRGITGPEEVFEGNKGFKESITGNFYIDWSKENLERVRKTIIKKYNAEIHSQATLEGLEILKNKYPIDSSKIKKIELHTFDVAYNIIGGGEEGSKKMIRTKEEADHSLPYMMAAMILDGQVLPEQYLPKRILQDDIQQLLQKVKVYENPEYSTRFPDEMACDITITFDDESTISIEKKDYEGFHTKPARWETVIKKFHLLATPFTTIEQRDQIVDMVQNIDDYPIRELMDLLALATIPTTV